MKIRDARKPPSRVLWALDDTPAGVLVVGISESGDICRASFLRGTSPEKVVDMWRKEWPQTEIQKGHLVGERVSVLLTGTPFQCAVWRALVAIPYGQTRTYADIAKKIGSPKAARAVGQACGANPVPFYIPCHRVVAKGGLGGFSGKLEIKQKLLKVESGR